MLYFEQEYILHLVIAEEEETNSVELSPYITAELNEKGELIGIEILQASTFVRDAILDGVQARLLNLTNAGKELRKLSLKQLYLDCIRGWAASFRWGPPPMTGRDDPLAVSLILGTFLAPALPVCVRDRGGSC